MKKLIVLYAGILLTASCFGQEFILDSIPPAMSEEEPGKAIRPPKRLQTYIGIGTEFTTSSGFGSGFSTYISPSLSYRVSPRFSVRTGVTISNTTLFNYRPWYWSEPSQQLDANFTKAMIWVQGSYMVTDRLTISGAGFKEFTLSDNSTYYNPYTDNNPYGIYLNASYKINDRMYIQAGFGYTKDYMPYMGSPMYDPSPFSRGSFHHQPFHHDPFYQDPFRW